MRGMTTSSVGWNHRTHPGGFIGLVAWANDKVDPSQPSCGCVARTVRWDLLLVSVAGEFVSGVSSGVGGAAEEVGD